MKQAGNENRFDPETFVVAIARSEIVVAPPARLAPRLPDGFDEADLAILDWIVAEGRSIDRRLIRTRSRTM